jgi:hypothetical protein
MVQVVENQRDAHDLACIELLVYRSPKERSDILGEIKFFEMATDREARLTRSPLGVKVEDAFAGALDLAAKRAIPFVWVNDPEGLFPPEKRGTVRHS